MKKKINIPFINIYKKGGKSFTILDQENILKEKEKSIFNIIQNIVKKNNTSKINYIKASTTKKYYDNLKKNFIL
jgi:hypothetical protein